MASTRKAAAGGDSRSVEISEELQALQMSESVMAEVLSTLHGEVVSQEARVRRMWEEERPLLQQKKETLQEQINILEKDVAEMHQKLEMLQGRCEEREQAVQNKYRKLLNSFYEKQNPVKLKDVDALIRQHSKSLPVLLDKIREHYQVEIDTSELKEAGIATCIDERDEMLGPFQEKMKDLWDEIANLEDIVLRSKEELERVKRNLYFPQCDGWRFRTGTDGIYLAIRDFWIEFMSCRLSLSVQDRVLRPKVLVVATGSQKPGLEGKKCNGGVLSFMVEKVGIFGERGTKVPSLRPDEMKLLVEFEIVLPLEFNGTSWKSSSKNFQFRILRIERKIKGSLYIPKNLVVMILNRVLPGLIKKTLVPMIPEELGHYLKSRYETFGREARSAIEPIHLDLDINLNGTSGGLGALSGDLGEFANQFVLGKQVEIFVAMQKQIDGVVRKRKGSVDPNWPGPLTSASAIVRYLLRFSDISFSAREYSKTSALQLSVGRDPAAIWEEIVSCWQQIMDQFALFHEVKTVNVGELFEKMRTLALKPVDAHLVLENVRLRMSVDDLFKMARTALKRRARQRHEEKRKRVGITKPLTQELEELEQFFDLMNEPVVTVKQSINTFSAELEAGGVAGNYSFEAIEVAFEGSPGISMPFEPAHFPPTHFGIDTIVENSSGCYNIDFLLAPFLHKEGKGDFLVFHMALQDLESVVYFDVHTFLEREKTRFREEMEKSCGDVLLENEDKEEEEEEENDILKPPTRRLSELTICTMDTETSTASQFRQTMPSSFEDFDEGEEDDFFVDESNAAKDPSGALRDFARNYSSSLSREYGSAQPADASLDERQVPKDDLLEEFGRFVVSSLNGRQPKMMSAKFSHEGQSRFRLNINAQDSTRIRARAKKVRLEGAFFAICEYVDSWIQHKQIVYGEPGPFRTLDSFRYFIEKFLSNEKNSWNLSFLAEAGTREEKFIVSLLQTSTSQQSPFNDRRSEQKAVFKTSFHILDVVSDIVNFMKDEETRSQNVSSKFCW